MIPAGVPTRSSAALLAALTALASSGCQRPGEPGPPHGAVDIGGGRSIFLDCQGDGSPTVLIIPGKGSYAEAWNVVVPQDDPIRSSTYDLIEQAALTPSRDAVQPTVARTTQVCAYDRPNTRPDGSDQSTPVAQPHGVAADVDDLLALIDSRIAATVEAAIHGASFSDQRTVLTFRERRCSPAVTTS